MFTKEIVNNQIKEMPNEFTLEELIERLFAVEKVYQSLVQLEQGETISEE